MGLLFSKTPGVRQHFLIRAWYGLQAVFLKRDRRCPFCCSDQREVVFKKEKLVDICHCLVCGLYWTNPIFNADRLYKYFYRADGSTTTVSRIVGADKNFSSIIAWLSRVVGGRRLLEFGSSWGYFLAQAREAGFVPAGVEISESRAQFGRDHLGVSIAQTIDAYIARNEKFDVIFSTHTLEHIGYDIRDIFQKFFAVLAERGVIVIEVPRLCLELGNSAFTVMGIVHPLGFTEEFFASPMLSSLGFVVEIHRGYGDLIRGDFNTDSLVVLLRKR